VAEVRLLVTLDNGTVPAVETRGTVESILRKYGWSTVHACLAEGQAAAAYPPARCMFSLRTRAYGLTGELDKWEYTSLPVSGPPRHGPAMHTPSVPRAGDFISLHLPGGMTSLRVVSVGWDYPGYGSRSWLVGKEVPDEGPLVIIIVEKSAGMFTDEADTGSPT